MTYLFYLLIRKEIRFLLDKLYSSHLVTVMYMEKNLMVQRKWSSVLKTFKKKKLKFYSKELKSVNHLGAVYFKN